jgi:hypothetical protein
MGSTAPPGKARASLQAEQARQGEARAGGEARIAAAKVMDWVDGPPAAVGYYWLRSGPFWADTCLVEAVCVDCPDGSPDFLQFFGINERTALTEVDRAACWYGPLKAPLTHPYPYGAPPAETFGPVIGPAAREA